MNGRVGILPSQHLHEGQEVRLGEWIEGVGVLTVPAQNTNAHRGLVVLTKVSAYCLMIPCLGDAAAGNAVVETTLQVTLAAEPSVHFYGIVGVKSGVDDDGIRSLSFQCPPLEESLGGRITDNYSSSHSRGTGSSFLNLA